MPNYPGPGSFPVTPPTPPQPTLIQRYQDRVAQNLIDSQVPAVNQQSSGGGSSAPAFAGVPQPQAAVNPLMPAPPGYGWGYDPTSGGWSMVDLSPLDPTKPASGWHWLPSDPNTPNGPGGTWTFQATPDILDKPFEGIPPAVIGWLQVALNQGGDTSYVPEGPARSWVNFLIQQATAPGRRPDELPFGYGVPNFDPTSMSNVPIAPGQPGYTSPPPTFSSDVNAYWGQLQTLKTQYAAKYPGVALNAGNDPVYAKFDAMESWLKQNNNTASIAALKGTDGYQYLNFYLPQLGIQIPDYVPAAIPGAVPPTPSAGPITVTEPAPAPVAPVPPPVAAPPPPAPSEPLAGGYWWESAGGDQ